MKELTFEIPVGLRINGDVHKDVELLKTNGVAEKIFTKKIAEKPFTWQGNIVAAAVKSIGNIQIAEEVRNNYLKNGAVTIPSTVLGLTLADVNALLVEIHRRVWVSKIPNQEIICKYCGRKLVADIDLDKIDYLPESKKKLEDPAFDYEHIVVNLEQGLEVPEIPKLTDKPEWAGVTDYVYNRLIFRTPLLSDAIKHEAYVSDSIGFWRRIAMDCLVSVQCVEDEHVVAELPQEFFTWYGIKIFNEFMLNRDLKAVRDGLIEYLPTLPFAYYEPCGCDEQREIPMVMETTNFFSE